MNFDSQIYESYVPVYDAMPEKWEEAQEFLTEQLKLISNSLNVKEIGWFLPVQLLSGKAVFPLAGPSAFRQVFRIVIPFPAGLVIGENTLPTGIIFDVNFTLFDMWCAATNTGTLTAQIITDSHVVINGTNVTVTSPGVFDRANLVIEYMLEQ
jgi:hypothetical protein